MSPAETVLRNLLDACDRGRPLSDIADRLRVEVGRLDEPTTADLEAENTDLRTALVGLIDAIDGVSRGEWGIDDIKSDRAAAAAALLGDEPTAAPTRQQAAVRLWDAIVSGGVVRSDQADAVIDHVTDTALSLSAAAPTRPTRDQVRELIERIDRHCEPGHGWRRRSCPACGNLGTHADGCALESVRAALIGGDDA